MSEIVKSKRKRIAGNLMKSSEMKKGILEVTEVREGMTETEFRVADAAVLAYEGNEVIVSRKPIKAVTDRDLTKEIGETLKFIVRDLGIKNWSGQDAAYDAARVQKLLRDYYGYLTFKEFELSFEMLMAGELDAYLPRNGSGQPDRGHYQAFSVEFATKVLRAFNSYKNKVWVKANRLLPEPEIVISEEQRKKNSDFFLSDIVEKFDRYKNDSVFPEFMAPFMVMDEFIKRGVISGYPEITDEDRKRGYYDLLKSSINPIEKSRAINEYQDGKDNERIESNSKRQSHRSAIKKVFDEIIKSGMDIRDVLT